MKNFFSAKNVLNKQTKLLTKYQFYSVNTKGFLRRNGKKNEETISTVCVYRLVYFNEEIIY